MTELRTYDQLLAEAIAVLTEAARLTRSVGAGTDQEHTEPADFAEFVTLAVAGAAANIGGIEAILAGRPGSWEADYVRNMLVSTVGEDPATLLAQRTEPLRVQVNVEDLLNDLDYWKLHDEATDEVSRRDEAIPEPGVPVDDDPEHRAVWDAYEAAKDVTAALYHRLDELLQADKAAYGAAFRASVEAAAAELYPNLPVPVEVVVDLDWQGGNLVVDDEWDGPAYQLRDRARMTTPLPHSGIAPKDYPPGGIAEADRAAGRTPLARLQSDPGVTGG